MRPSPRQRRLESDLRALEALRAESSIFDFAASASEPSGPVDNYLVRFRGPSYYRAAARGEVGVGREHEVLIRLGAAYPRQAPALAWQSPIFHPNISTSGAVCLGGYSKFWVPSLHLDQLCEMLWDMLRLRNFDVQSPYNREAAAWLAARPELPLPLDDRPLRDLARDVQVVECAEAGTARMSPVLLQPFHPTAPAGTVPLGAADQSTADEIQIIEADVVVIAEPEIVYIE